jgi:hypothetical protein
MRCALGAVREVTDEMLRYAVHLGYEEIVVNTPQNLPGDTRWEAADLLAMERLVENYAFTNSGHRKCSLRFPLRDHGRWRTCISADRERPAHRAITGRGRHSQSWIPLDGQRSVAHKFVEARARGARLTEFNFEQLSVPDNPTHARVLSRTEISCELQSNM